MNKLPPKLDDFELMIFRLGYLPSAETQLKEETEYNNPHKIFPNLRPLKNIIRDFGFQEDSIIRIRYFNNKYYGIFYTTKNSTNDKTFQKNITQLGFLEKRKLKLNEEIDFRNHKRIYPNIYPIIQFTKNLGFQEDIVSRIKLNENDYIAINYIRNS